MILNDAGIKASEKTLLREFHDRKIEFFRLKERQILMDDDIKERKVWGAARKGRRKRRHRPRQSAGEGPRQGPEAPPRHPTRPPAVVQPVVDSTGAGLGGDAHLCVCRGPAQVPTPGAFQGI